MPDQPTPAELRALAAFAIHGDQQRAADELGISRNTLREQLRSARERLGAVSSVQAFYRAVELGYITVRRVEAA